MDRDHDAIAAALDDLEAAANEQRTELLAEGFDQLIGLMVAHFSAEESMLLAHRYPKLPSHADAHRASLAAMREVQRQALDGVSASDIVARIVDLRGRFYEDLLMQDREYMWYFRDRAIYPEVPQP